jgi:hypothetical protein
LACSEELSGVDEKIRFQRRRQTKPPDSSDRFDQLGLIIVALQPQGG